MKYEVEDTLEIDIEDFKDVVTKFSKKAFNTYDFLTKSGLKYQEAIYELCKGTIEKEEVPKCFNKTTLIMIWKMKGPMNILKNNRFLHMKNVLARTVDALGVSKMKDELVKASSIYQVGGLPGHIVNEHLLFLKTVMAEKEKKGFIFLVIDFVSFFDHEDIFDCLNTLDKINVNKKAKRLWYLLNKDTIIQIKTAHGMTDEEEVGDCLGQGTAGAGLISAANLDQGLQKFFNQSEHENEDKNNEVMKMGKVRLQPIAYQDDVGSMCEDVEMLRKQAERLSKMTKEKVLQAHPDKSGIIILGSEKYKKSVEVELEKNPVYLTNFKLDIKTNDKYV